MKSLLKTITVLLFGIKIVNGYNEYGDDAVQQQVNYDDVKNEVYDDAYSSNDDYNSQNQGGNIVYWTDYAIMPRRCINYNGQDQIVYSIFSNAGKQCSDTPMGTYVTPVPKFVEAYLDLMLQQAEDRGEDFEEPDAAVYTDCTQYNENYYLQLGCSDESSKKLAVNIYSDAGICQQSSKVNGKDDANVSVYGLQPPFGSCMPCVVWVDSDDQKADDGFYTNRQQNPPLCKSVWNQKSECNKSCQKIGRSDDKEPVSWNASDKVLIVILGSFAVGMLVKIIMKRRTMSNKNALIEQAALSSLGLTQMHVIGLLVLLVLIIAIFGLLGLKSMTWALLLLLNLVFFAYLMRLTVGSGVGRGAREPMIGPDGTVIPGDDNDDSSDEEDSDDSDDEGEAEDSKPKGELA